MKVLVINWRCARNPLAGGAEIYLQEIFRRLVERGHEVCQLAERYPGSAPEETLDGIRVIRVGGARTFNFAVCRNLRRVVEEGGYDVVVDDLNKIPFYSPRLVRVPVLVILMHLFRGSIFREAFFPLAAYVWLAESAIPWAYRDCRFTVLSESSKRDVVKLGIRPERVAVVPPGTDFERFSADENVAREPVVLHVGRLKKYKSTDHLLRAARLLRDRGREFRAVIVGTGDDRPRLEKLAAELELGDTVEFTGFISEDEKVNWYRRSAVLVENSVKEGWGLIVMEANGCGTPVVVARSPGLVDSSRDGVNGLFYEYGNIPDLAEKLDRVLTDDELRGRLGRQAIGWARQWTWDAAADATEQALEQCRETNSVLSPRQFL
ncbi:glycosyltransferase family 4 protein [candidate division WOR-3 bacterium]|nr:glycosyltransferase family 4 protein [candidate division WOR-3 bacterium]